MTNKNLCDLINDCRISRKNKKETIKDKKAESKSKCLIENPHESSYNLIEFENCVFKDIQNVHKKCDFGVETGDTIYYIELKGSNNNQGLKQLLNTIELTKNCFKTVGENNKEVFKKIESVLVVSQIQTPRNLDAITLKKIALQIGKTQIIEKNIYTINI